VSSSEKCRSAVRRRWRLGDLSADDAEAVVTAFDRDVKIHFRVEGVQEEVVDLAASLIDSFDLRAYDAIQLAA
jgi:predicted nucleic acid-binding protein